MIIAQRSCFKPYPSFSSFIRLNKLSNIIKLSSSNKWISSISTKEDLFEGIQNVLGQLNGQLEDNRTYFGIMFLSSIYDQSTVDIPNILLNNIKGLVGIMGCTSACVIGSIESLEPMEVEGRPGIVLTLIPFETANLYHFTSQEIMDFKGITDGFNLSQERITDGFNSSLSIILCTESCKSSITPFISALSSKYSHIYGNIVGLVASSVTALHAPKVFISESLHSEQGTSLIMNKILNGAVGITLTDDVSNHEYRVHRIIARSTTRVGSVYKIAQSNKAEILSLSKEHESNVSFIYFSLLIYLIIL